MFNIKGPYQVELQVGKNYAWCSCGKSSKMPYCDGSHSTTDKKPMVFKTDETGKAVLCGCQLSMKAPYCDGSHASGCCGL